MLCRWSPPEVHSTEQDENNSYTKGLPDNLGSSVVAAVVRW